MIDEANNWVICSYADAGSKKPQKIAFMDNGSGIKNLVDCFDVIPYFWLRVKKRN